MTTIPFVPDPLPRGWPGPHGRLGAGDTLLWPGGPLTSPGHGGRGPFALPLTGAGVGAGVGVGRGVGRGVGLAVAVAVGAGVAVPAGVAVGAGVAVPAGVAVGVGTGVRAGVAVGAGVAVPAGVAVGAGVAVPAGVAAGDVEPGVGVEPPAVIGPSLGGVEPDGATGGSPDGVADGLALPPLGLDGPGAEGLACDGPGVAGLALARATPPSGPVGVTNPAVSATVARMRFRSPMATTRRAR